jgi:hypothetical protein
MLARAHRIIPLILRQKADAHRVIHSLPARPQCGADGLRDGQNAIAAAGRRS